MRNKTVFLFQSIKILFNALKLCIVTWKCYNAQQVLKGNDLLLGPASCGH